MEAKTTRSYRSLDAIRARKEYILKDIQQDDKQIRNLWGNLFHKPSLAASSKLPSRRINSLMTTSAGIFDGIILAWKLYRKFHKKKK
ncbi:MAG: hypothetical protein IJK42_06440 [Prevotella sp.]|nr:hypothetical protein [Prevotella sp.]